MLSWSNISVALKPLVRPIALWACSITGTVIGQTIAVEAPLVDFSHTQRAYRLVAQWLDPQSQSSSEKIPVTGLIGVRVTLRHAGYTLGAGEMYRDDLDQALNRPGPPIDLVPLVHAATKTAITAAKQKLQDVNIRAQIEGRLGGVAKAPSLEQLGRFVLIELQIGHRLQLVRVPEDATINSIFAKFCPGYHGLRVVAPNAKQPRGSLIWPASAITANIQPDRQLRGLLANQGYDEKSIKELGRPGGPILHRFETLHIVCTQPNTAPRRLVRGNQPIEAHTVDTKTLEAMATNLARHLQERFIQDGARGMYHPTRDRYDPILANPQQAALACYAIDRHDRSLWHRDRNSQQQMATKIVQKVAQAIGRDALDPDGAAGPAAAALVLLTLTDSGTPQPATPLRNELGQLLLSLHNPANGVDSSPEPKDVSVNQATAALMAAALAAAYEQTRVPEMAQASQAALATIRQEGPRAMSLYWFTLAHRHLSKSPRGNDDPSADQAHRERSRYIADLVKILNEQQVIESPLLGPDDVLGGFELYRAARGSPPQPDWRSTSLLAFLAAALGNSHITQDQDINGWILAANLGTRFIAQLMMDRANCFAVPNKKRALGGVRLSLWDNRLAIDPTAMGLLAMVELQESLIAIEIRKKPPK